MSGSGDWSEVGIGVGVGTMLSHLIGPRGITLWLIVGPVEEKGHTREDTPRLGSKWVFADKQTKTNDYVAMLGLGLCPLEPERDIS
jgi:hypothetical protein